MHDRRCAHLTPSVTPLEPRISCDTVATRTSGGAACSPTLGVSPPRALGTLPLTRTGAPPSLALWIRELTPPTWEPPPPRVRVREPRPPQPSTGGPPWRTLSGNRRRRTCLGGRCR
jgi:hypothetical protein